MTPVRGSLLRSLARPWFRGRATRQGEMIVLDQMERYEPMREPRIGIELARVRTPDEAVSFVARFGLLDRPRNVPYWEPCPADGRQPFADFERAAEDLRKILRLIHDVRKATAGDADALAQLRKDFGPKNPDDDVTRHTASGTRTIKAREILSDEDFAEVDDRTILVRASDWAAWGLNDGLLQADAHPYVFEPAQIFPDSRAPPGHLRIGVLPETLLGFCYLTIAQAAAHEPLATCEECQRVFVVDDARQKFCDPKCAGRARFRRFKTNQTVKTIPKKKRSRHGNTTRTRRR